MREGMKIALAYSLDENVIQGSEYSNALKLEPPGNPAGKGESQ